MHKKGRIGDIALDKALGALNTPEEKSSKNEECVKRWEEKFEKYMRRREKEFEERMEKREKEFNERMEKKERQLKKRKK